MKTFIIYNKTCTIDLDFETCPKVIITIGNNMVKEFIFNCPMFSKGLYDEMDEKQMKYFIKKAMLYRTGAMYDQICYCLN